jgi:CheY-like chemotaxis protein
MNSQFQQILLVDDDQISSIVSAAILKEVHLHMVYDGKQALDFLLRECIESSSKEEPFCPVLLLLDLNMPVMDGFEFLEAYTHHSQLNQLKIAIIVLTSSAHPADKEKAYRYPIKGFITKPITPEKLLSVLS